MDLKSQAKEFMLCSSIRRQSVGLISKVNKTIVLGTLSCSKKGTRLRLKENYGREKAVVFLAQIQYTHWIPDLIWFPKWLPS